MEDGESGKVGAVVAAVALKSAAKEQGQGSETVTTLPRHVEETTVLEIPHKLKTALDYNAKVGQKSPDLSDIIFFRRTISGQSKKSYRTLG